MTLLDRERAIARVCFEAEPRSQDLALLGDAEKWLLYRRMVRDRLARLVADALPLTEQAVGAPVLRAVAETWLGSAPPRTPYFRETVDGFVAFVDGDAYHLRSPDWARDLLRLEHARWTAGHRPTPPAPPVLEFQFDRQPVFAHAPQLLDLTHAAHLITRDRPGPPPPTPTWLCVFRDRECRVRSRPVTELEHDVVRRMLTADGPLTDLVRAACTAHGVQPTPEIVTSLGGLLAELIEAGVLVGSRSV